MTTLQSYLESYNEAVDLADSIRHFRKKSHSIIEDVHTRKASRMSDQELTLLENYSSYIKEHRDDLESISSYLIEECKDLDVIIKEALGEDYSIKYSLDKDLSAAETPSLTICLMHNIVAFFTPEEGIVLHSLCNDETKAKLEKLCGTN